MTKKQSRESRIAEAVAYARMTYLHTLTEIIRDETALPEEILPIATIDDDQARDAIMAMVFVKGLQSAEE